MLLHKEVCLALTALFSRRAIWEQFEDYWHSESVTQLDLSNYLKNRSIAHDHRGAINQLAKVFVRRLQHTKLTEILTMGEHLTVILR